MQTVSRSLSLSILAGGLCSAGLAMTEPPAPPAPDRYASTLKQVQDIVQGATGVTKILPGQCVQLNDGNYLNDTTGIGSSWPGEWRIRFVNFDPPITVRSGTRRYKGYGPDGGLTTGSAITRKLTLDGASGIVFDGFAIHRGARYLDRDAPVYIYKTTGSTPCSRITFRCTEFFGFVPRGTESNWKNMGYGDIYQEDWLNLPWGIYLDYGGHHSLTVEHSIFRFLGHAALSFEGAPNSIARYNAFEYIRSDAVKFGGTNNGLFEGNIMWKFFPTRGADGGMEHADAYQSTQTNVSATSNCTFRNNLMMDRGRGMLQGIFAEQDGSGLAGPSGHLLHDNIFFIGSQGTAAAIGYSAGAAGVKPGNNNRFRRNTIIADRHLSNSNPNVTMWFAPATGSTGNDASLNVSDHYMVYSPATQTGNKTMGDSTYSTTLNDYHSGSSAIEGLLVNGVLQPSVLRRLSWKIGNTTSDPNLNGGAGAWRAFAYYGATPIGWVAPSAVPSPWQNADIGSPAAAGNAVHNNGIFTVDAGGTDIWGTSDQFHYVYRPLNGDGSITVKVDTLVNTNSWAKSGVMIRDGLAGNARNATVLVTPTNGVTFQARTTPGGTSTNIASPGGAAPYWLKLTRTGNSFTAFKSTDGSNWGTAIGSMTVVMGSTVNIGLCTTSHEASVTTISSFSNVAVTQTAQVVNRRLFYRNSKFDGNGNVSLEDSAVAPDKQSLLPGQTATFANYTSYSRGINGLVVDVTNLAGTVSAADFTFKVGNSNTPGTWTDAPAPQSVTQRPGPSGSTRISIVWANNAIQKQWLQVTLKANATTGLSADDVFYFGNAIGEAGDSAANAMVNPSDEYLTRINPRTLLNPAPIDFAYDFDRDGLVNPSDGYIARINPATLLTAIKLITVP